MNKKLLTLALASAALATVVLPSAFADETPEVTTEVGSGVLTLVGVGAYASSADIALTGSLSTPPLDTVTAAFDAAAGDYFVLTDTEADDGSHVKMYFDSADYVYSGTAPNPVPVPVENTSLIPNANGSFAAIAPTVSVSGSGEITFNVIEASSAAAAESVGLYSFPNLGGNNLLEGTLSTGAGSLYFNSEAEAPFVGYLRLDRVELAVPGGAATGEYSNVLNVVAVAGNAI